MAPITTEEKHRLARVVEGRVGSGPTEMVAGWQALLDDLLNRMKPFLKLGGVVTFQQLTPEEASFFERLNQSIRVPSSAAGLYLPPSVRHQMMGGQPDHFDPAGLADAGALIASMPDNHDTIVNALFALPPFTPAIDVYDRGQLLAGYQYQSVDACHAELGTILHRHLSGPNSGLHPDQGEN